MVSGKAVPLQDWSGPEGSRKLRFPDFMTSQDGCKVVSLTHRSPLPPGNTPVTHICYRLSRPQGHSAIGMIMSMKNSNDTIWIEPATFRFVAQHLNHCATADPNRIRCKVKLLSLIPEGDRLTAISVLGISVSQRPVSDGRYEVSGRCEETSLAIKSIYSSLIVVCLKRPLWNDLFVSVVCGCLKWKWKPALWHNTLPSVWLAGWLLVR